MFGNIGGGGGMCVAPSSWATALSWWCNSQASPSSDLPGNFVEISPALPSFVKLDNSLCWVLHDEKELRWCRMYTLASLRSSGFDCSWRFLKGVACFEASWVPEEIGHVWRDVHAKVVHGSGDWFDCCRLNLEWLWTGGGCSFIRFLSCVFMKIFIKENL